MVAYQIDLVLAVYKNFKKMALKYAVRIKKEDFSSQKDGSEVRCEDKERRLFFPEENYRSFYFQPWYPFSLP